MRRSRKVKILATLGPASAEKATVRRLFEAGADVFRINMSHTDHDRLRSLVGISGVTSGNGRCGACSVDSVSCTVHERCSPVSTSKKPVLS